MDRQTIIAVIICVLILVFWTQIAQYLGFIKEPSQQETARQHPADSLTVTETQPTTTTPKKETPPESTDIAKTMASIKAVDSLIPERTFTVTTPIYELTFSNYGGGLKKIILQKYTYNDNGCVILAEDADKVVPDFETSGGSFIANRLIFECDRTDFELFAGSEPQKIEFIYNNGDSGRIIKTYTVNPDRYDIEFDITIEGIESFGFERSYQLVWGITPPPTEKNLQDDYGHYKAVAMMDDHRDFDDFDNGVMNENIPGYTVWAGLRTKYFAVVMIPRNRDADGIIAKGTRRETEINGKSIDVRQISAALNMPIANYGTVSDSYTLYVGPINYKILKSYNIGLEELSSLGWIIIKPFSIAIIWLLPKIYSVIANYGVVVIIFAFLIKLITYPLSKKQNVAMSKMKDLQPKMKALQEKLKNDPARLNKEMMKLYKEAGANPLSGCLPMLPQMPLFFALFTVFRTTIEFRGASFAGWITDLSTPDPYYILPIIMVVVMFIQQKLTMTDPKNKMMVYAMPLFFGWISFKFPAGLVLYWTSFSIISFFETMLVRRQQTAVKVIEEKK